MTKNKLDDATLEAMSVDDLEEVSARMTELIAGKKLAEKATLRHDIEQMLAQHGLELPDVFEELAPKRRRRRPPRTPTDENESRNGHDAAHD